MTRPKIKFITILLIFNGILLSCTEKPVKPIPFDRKIWTAKGDDFGNNNSRYDMSIWMIRTNWFENKTKQDIIENLYQVQNDEIENATDSFCIKRTDRGWNIDFNPYPLAYLYIYFDDSGKVVKAMIRERKQTFGDKMDGEGKVSTDFKTTFVWEKDD